MRKICVYCGSSPGNGNAYLEAAERLAEELVKRDFGLVYGGANVGVMGALANAVMEQGGQVVGIIPEALIRKEVGHPHLTELQVVDSMHERKAAMADQADGFVALPGGMGTLEELFEILTWAQLGFHHKPIGLLNVAGYFDPLVRFLDHSVDQGFISSNHRALLQIHQQPGELLDAFAHYQPPVVERWLRREEQL